MKTMFLLFLLLASLSIWAQDLKDDLEKLYRTNPGLTTQLNPEILQREATKTLGDETAAKRIAASLDKDLDEFMKSRSSAIEALRTHPLPNLKRVVVSGQSVTGMVNAAIAAQSGHQVSVYDLRMRYTRDIQWSSRQSVLDILASIDPKLAERFKEEVATDLKRGYLALNIDGTSHQAKPAFMQKPDPRRIPQEADAMLSSESVATVQTRKFEELLFDYLSKHPNVVQKKGKIEVGPLDPQTNEHLIIEYEDVTPKGQTEKVYKKVTEGYPITLIAEGSGSSNRTALNIKSVPTSPKRLQVAGVVEVENGGEIVTHYRSESPGRLITGSMGTSGSGKRWVVADIDEAKIAPDKKKFGLDPSTPAYKAERERLLEKEFKRIAGLNMRMDNEKVSGLKAAGAIEGMNLQTFELQQRISSRASSGSNVLLVADAVGNGHWSVGGGMHVGAVSHAERFKQYLTAVDGGSSPKIAALEYSKSALADSRAWGEHGLYYFYNNLSHEQAGKAYQDAVDLYNQGKVSSPERALELMLPAGRSSHSVKNIKLNCADIVRYVLGDI